MDWTHTHTRSLTVAPKRKRTHRNIQQIHIHAYILIEEGQRSCVVYPGSVSGSVYRNRNRNRDPGPICARTT